MKAPEKLGGIESFWGDKDGKEVKTKTTFPKSQKKEKSSLTNVTPARSFPADRKRGIWGLASFHNTCWSGSQPPGV